MTQSIFNLASINGTNGFIVNGTIAGGYLGFSVSSIGDFDGDGKPDFAVGALGATINGMEDVGQVYVVFSGYLTNNKYISVVDLDGTNGFAVNGIQANATMGNVLTNIGDINGDKYTDLLIGASGVSPSSELTKAGQAYVIYGGSGPFNSTINLAKLDGRNGFTLNGANAYEQAGMIVGGVGDINGDGMPDFAVGAPHASDGYPSNGAVYIIYGTKNGFPPTLDLGSIDGTNGFKIIGIRNYDRIGGNQVVGNGDFNGDGIRDFVFGTAGATPNNLAREGQGYIVFGQKSFPAVLSLSELNGSNGVIFNGAGSLDYFGFGSSMIGDFNGDGLSDVAFGAPQAITKTDTGMSYIVYGTKQTVPAVVQMSNLPASMGFNLLGISDGSVDGASNTGIGDVNQDGYDDYMTCAYHASPNGVDRKAGQCYVLFGTKTPFPSLFYLYDLNGQNGFAINGANSYDEIGVGIAGLGDINGDSYPDFAIGAWTASPSGVSEAGQLYVVYGSSDFSPNLDYV